VELGTMKITIRILLLLLTVLVFSCEEQPFFVKCDECVADEPLNADIIIKLNRSEYGIARVINIYNGNLEDNILLGTIQTSSDETSVRVSLNQKYTLTVTYSINHTIYIAVDSATPRVTYNKDQCNDPCYYIYDKSVDLRLKYTR
jgi:hypothetical protein